MEMKEDESESRVKRCKASARGATRFNAASLCLWSWLARVQISLELIREGVRCERAASSSESNSSEHLSLFDSSLPSSSHSDLARLFVCLYLPLLSSWPLPIPLPFILLLSPSPLSIKMAEPTFATPAWNSSFDDNDASTTLDTSLETENGSIVRYDMHNGHRPKVLTSRSSPGAPLGKEIHTMLGYFDDVDTFSTKALRLHYDDVPSFPGLAHPSHSASHTHSPIDNAITSDGGESMKVAHRGGIHGLRCDLDVMHESDEGADADLSSPVMSTPPPPVPVQSSNDFARRSARSHTSQGIPSHSLLCDFDSDHENKGAIIEKPNGDLEKENEEVSTTVDHWGGSAYDC